MPAISSTAPGKVILFGEHAVVYGQPAIAIPVTEVAAKAIITPDPAAAAGSIHITAPQINLDANFTDLPSIDPLVAAIRATLDVLGIAKPPAFRLRVTSTIPVAGGLGSGAAVSVAIIRSVSAFLGHPLPDVQVSALAFDVEKLHHGTPSGIDNTVITYGKAVYYIKDKRIEMIPIAKSFNLVVADTGISTPTKETVADVRRHWESDPEPYNKIFESIGKLAIAARAAIEQGNNENLGPLMNENHELLQKLDVSSPDLDKLVLAAREAGGWGAKLSGGGRGGNMIALAPRDRADEIKTALEFAGAKSAFITVVK
ncbi:MAG: mevalonate kinase [Chloroflexi bacterium]|nr:mevalonate kinase [Chloroflexota bacterium]